MDSESGAEAASVPYENFSSQVFNTKRFTIWRYTFTARELCLIGGLAVAAVVAVAMVGVAATPRGQTVDSLCMEKECLEATAYVTAFMNDSVDPCDDFHQYACGLWPLMHPLTPEQDQRTVVEGLRSRNQEKLRSLLEEPPSELADWSTEKKLKNFFTSCMNDYLRESRGGRPFVNKVVANIGGWYVLSTFDPNTFDLNSGMKKVVVDYWVQALFKTSVVPDETDTTKHIITIEAGGLDMPYSGYLDNTMAQMRYQYKAFMVSVGQLLVDDSEMNLDPNSVLTRLTQFADDIFNFETKLANVTRQASITICFINCQSTSKRLTLNQLNTEAPGLIDWTGLFRYMFADAGVNGDTIVVLKQAKYLPLVAEMISSFASDGSQATNNRILNNYLVWRATLTYMQSLSAEYIKQANDWYSSYTGSVDLPPKWKMCIGLMSRYLDPGLGALFIADHLVDRTKETVQNMVDNLKQSLLDHLQDLKWMDEATFNVAKAKMQAFTDKLAYPDMLADRQQIDTMYQSLDLQESLFFQNMLNLASFEKSLWNKKLVSKVDKSEWQVGVYEPEAYYKPIWNELLVPAGFIEFPVYAGGLPAYMNYGALATFMAREMLGVVGERGRTYDANGDRLIWWSKDTTESYLENRKCVQDAFGGLQAGPYNVPDVDPSKPVYVTLNGMRMAQPAIDEIGGARLAYRAWLEWLKVNPLKPMPSLGLNNKQLFWLAHAQSQCKNRRDTYSYSLIRNGYLPEDIRINGALSHLQEFSRDFNCPVGSNMNPAKKCYVF